MADKFLENIFKNSEKRRLLESLEDKLELYDKAVIVLLRDKPKEDGGGFATQTMLLGVETDYEAVGILEFGKQDVHIQSLTEPEDDDSQDSPPEDFNG